MRVPELLYVVPAVPSAGSRGRWLFNRKKDGRWAATEISPCEIFNERRFSERSCSRRILSTKPDRSGFYTVINSAVETHRDSHRRDASSTLVDPHQQPLASSPQLQ